jgi:rsbT antagonist protein RsbS
MERIPILKMGSFLLVSIQVDMHDRLALQLQDDLTSRIAATSATGVLIDISALEMVDSFIGRMLGNVELGMSLTGVRTALDVERGMEALRASLEREGWQDDVASR